MRTAPVVSIAALAMILLTGCAHNKASPMQDMSPVKDRSEFKLGKEELQTLKRLSSDNPFAAFRVYEYYEFFKFDQEQAMYYLHLSANQGYAKAQYSLGNYMTFLTGYIDFKGAKMWLHKAAQQGDQDAAKELAELDARGK